MDKDYLLEKWLNEELSDAEKLEFSTSDDYELHLKILETAKTFKASHFSNVDDFNTFKKIYEAKNQSVPQTNWIKPFLRIAAVLVIAVAAYFGLFYNPITQIQTLASEKVTIELPDHSQVTLNAASEIIYRASDWKKNRRLELKGEAYFKVAKGKTFDVVTSDGIVTVVGTEFNVKQREDYFAVQCYEGIVRVTSDSIIRELHAGDSYQILNKNFKEDKIDYRISKWTQNTSTFKSIPFKEIVLELERQYAIKVTFKNVSLDRIFTGGFVHDNLPNALISITQPMNFTYEMITSNQVVIRGNEE